MTDDEYEALLRKVEDLEDILAMRDSLSAPEDEASGLKDYELYGRKLAS